MRFKHKDQKFFKSTCELFPSFEKRFEKACREQWNDGTNFVIVGREGNNIFNWTLTIPKSDIIVTSTLPKNKWYPASDWDGPHTCLVLMKSSSKHYLFTGYAEQTLPDWVTKFMLLPKA